MVLAECDPERAVPIIHFHALDDTSVPFNGGFGSGYTFPSVMSVLETWIGENGCVTEPDTIFNNNGIPGRKWTAADNNADVVLYTTPTGGHTWPVNTISATDKIWEFFVAHPQTPTHVASDDGQMIKDFVLKQNYPNPFNPSTTIAFVIPQASDVTLKIYNLLGREVATLIAENIPPGNYKRSWSPVNFSSGEYFYRLQAGYFVQTRKLLLLR